MLLCPDKGHPKTLDCQWTHPYTTLQRPRSNMATQQGSSSHGIQATWTQPTTLQSSTWNAIHSTAAQWSAAIWRINGLWKPSVPRKYASQSRSQPCNSSTPWAPKRFNRTQREHHTPPNIRWTNGRIQEMAWENCHLPVQQALRHLQIHAQRSTKKRQWQTRPTQDAWNPHHALYICSAPDGRQTHAHIPTMESNMEHVLGEGYRITQTVQTSHDTPHGSRL